MEDAIDDKLDQRQFPFLAGKQPAQQGFKVRHMQIFLLEKKPPNLVCKFISVSITHIILL